MPDRGTGYLFLIPIVRRRGGKSSGARSVMSHFRETQIKRIPNGWSKIRCNSGNSWLIFVDSGTAEPFRASPPEAEDYPNGITAAKRPPIVRNPR